VTGRPLGALAKFRGRHFISDQDYTPQELRELLGLAIALKALRARKRLTPFLLGRHVAAIFEEPSTRTRVSFENGCAELGMNMLYLRPGELHLPGRESIYDTGKVLSRYNDAIVARLTHLAVFKELAAASSVPTINGLCSDSSHPVQSLTDVMTVFEHAGRIEGLTMGWLGRANGMCNSVILTCTRLGMNVVWAGPEAMPLKPEIIEQAQANGEISGATLTVSHEPADGVRDADFIYTDTWWWVQQEDDKGEMDRRLQINLPYQVNRELWAKAKPGARFLHCLPAMRGNEVSDEIIDSPASIVFDEAENRLHFQKALLLALIGIDELPADPDLQEIGRALLS
jgi:ornithine carbamoyltransferase